MKKNVNPKNSISFSHIALFIIYFWFGFLKIAQLSPANPLVHSLQQSVLPFVPFGQFIITFGLFEMLIGVLFLIPHLKKFAVFAFSAHMITAILPLIVLPTVTWSGFLIPSLEGQYILKNFALIALVINIVTQEKK